HPYSRNKARRLCLPAVDPNAQSRRLDGMRREMSEAPCPGAAPSKAYRLPWTSPSGRDSRDYKSRDQARGDLFDYMEVFYNRQRRHPTIDYESPLDFEARINS